jgi:hypothetical protein
MLNGARTMSASGRKRCCRRLPPGAAGSLTDETQVVLRRFRLAPDA